MKNRIARLLVAATVLAGTAACVPKVESPDVRVAGVRLAGLGLEGGLVYVRLSIINPNSFPLEAGGLTYDLDLTDPAAGDDGWIGLADGRFTEAVRVGAQDSTVAEIPVEFSYAGVGGALRSVLNRGTVGYRIRGRIALDEPLSTEIPYRHSGTVTLLGD